MPPAPGIKGEGTVTDPFVVEENPFTFDWCGFPPNSMVIIQGKQNVAERHEQEQEVFPKNPSHMIFHFWHAT